MRPTTSSRYRWIPLLTALALNACVYNPATGERQLILVGEGREITMGMEADKQVAGSMGLVEDESLQQYVDEIGQRMAASSERPALPWKFRVVDDPIVNAFALPGGFIYLTRGILAHFNSEAEMASVLGHEIGHVTGRHSVEQMSHQQLGTIGLSAAMIGAAVAGVPELQQLGGLAEAGMGLLFLKYGRDDEREADDLGLRYMVRQNYDPSHMPLVFDTLARVSQSQGGGRIPAWLSTHPAPEERAQRVRAVLDEMPAGERIVRRESYLSKIDGIVFGEDPRQGYFDGARFYHPDLAFQLDFPGGWRTVNQKTQVAGMSANQDAVLVLTLARAKDAADAARSFFSQQGLRANQPQSTKINGLVASSGRFEASTRQGAIAGVATFVEHGGKVYQLVGYTGSRTWSSYGSAFEDSMRSFRKVSDKSVLNIEAGRIDIVTLPRSMTLEEFARRYDSTVDIQTLSLINQFAPDENIASGTMLKRVVGGPRRK